jgi:hypothetical protein
VRFLGVGSDSPIPQVVEQIRGLLDELLRIQLGGPRARLDIVLLADLEQPSAAVKSKALCQGLSDLLAADYGRIFPPSAPPDQRMVFLVPIFATPALSDKPETRACLDLLSSLEQWHTGKPSSPILSRIYLLPRQHEFGVMAEEDVERAVTMFATAAWFSGLRDEPRVAELLAHTRPERLVSCFNAAAADVPVDNVVRYFGWRTTSLGLNILQARCARHSTEFGSRGEAESALDFKAWLREIEEGECARAARDFGQDSAVGRAVSSARDRFRWSESSERVAKEVAALIEEVERGVAVPHAGSGVVPDDDEDIVVRLDRAEGRALRTARERLRTFVDRELSPHDGLRRFGEIDGVLALVEQWLLERQKESSRHPLEHDGPSRSGPDAGVAESRRAVAAVRAAVAGRPSLWGTLGMAAAIGTLLTPASIGVRTAFGSATNWGNVSNVASVDWVLHSLIAVLLLGLWSVLRLSTGAQRLRRAVLQLRRARDARRDGPVVVPGGAAGNALQLRRARVAGVLAGAVSDERARLQGLRASISEAVRRAAEELKGLGYQGASDTRPGDASGVLGKKTPLHLHLLEASGLEPLWRQTRQTSDDEGWASQLLQAAWPREGLEHDFPFDPEAADWVELARSGQHGRLLESSVFSWPGLEKQVTDRLADFLQEAPRALGLGADPHDKHGNPLPANVSQNLLVVAPQEGRDAVRVAEKKANSRRETIFGVVPTSHVVLLRTHAGFTSHQLWYGIERRSGS